MSEELNTVEKHVSAPILRKTFYAEKDGEEFSVSVCGLGFYRTFINGVEIGDAFGLSPYCNPDDILIYDRFDLKEYIKKGKNALTFILGNGIMNALDNGIWDFEKAAWRSSPKIALALFKGDEIISEAEDLKCKRSAITFDDLRCGCRYDARNEIEGVFEAEFDDSDWQTAIHAATPKGEKRERTSPKVKAIRKITPAPFVVSPSGRYLFDFKENIAGVCELKINATAGQIITLDHGEYTLSNELCVDNIDSYERAHMGYIQKDVYIAKDGEQTFTPSFTFHGFKYVAISGITEEQAKSLSITAIVTHPDFLRAGEFWCDSDIINDVQDAVIRSNLSNMVLVPTDCPHREKNGWTGDVALSAEQFLYNHKAESFLRFWLSQVVKAQREDGAFPGIVPTGGWGFNWGNGPAWDIALPELAYRLYIATGDIKIYEEVYASIVKYLAYLKTKKNENGLFSFGLGDWCETGTMWGGSTKTPLELTDTCTIINYYTLAERIFTALNKTEDLKKAEKEKAELIAKFRNLYVKGVSVYPQIISVQAMAILYGVFSEEEKKDAEKVLREMIEKDEYGMRVGVLGGRALFEVLSEYGDAELAYKLITKREFPSYAYMLWAYDGKTLGEAFNEVFEDNKLRRKDGERHVSFNHHFWGFVSTFFYKYLAGIRLKSENAADIDIKLISGVNKLKASHEFISGSVTVELEKTSFGARVTVTVKNADITFIFPEGFKRSGEKIKLKDGVNEIELVKAL